MTWANTNPSPDPEDEQQPNAQNPLDSNNLPPIADDDTNPHMQPVKIDEPPIDPVADTNPSIEIYRVGFMPPEETPMWRSVVGLGMLMLAAALVLVAGFILFVPLLQPEPEAPATLPPTAIMDEPTEPVVAAAVMSDAGQPALSMPSPEEIAALLNREEANAIDQPISLSIPREDGPFTIIPDRPRSEVITYAIQAGDTITSIAERFGLEKDTIGWSNDSYTVFSLRTGNELFIMPVDGVYFRALVDETIQSVADEYDVDPFTIINSEFNDLFGATPASLISGGSYVVVPGGTGSYNDWTYNPTVERTGTVSSGGDSSGSYISFASGQPGSCGSQSNPGGTGYFVSPLAAYSWVRGYAGYHSGVDLDAPTGSPIYASSAGRVIYAGWNNWGYGYLVVLAHGPFTTFYAHQSAIYVSCGQYVNAGTPVGAVGNTGNSTGPHLHFEIRYNDSPVDPVGYVPF